jgi:hypothetical protein
MLVNFSQLHAGFASCGCLTLKEIRDYLGALKNHKAPGTDNISAELLKYGRNKVINAVCNLLTLIWEQEQIPVEWNKSTICPIHNNVDKLRCENYRGIASLCIQSIKCSPTLYTSN